MGRGGYLCIWGLDACPQQLEWDLSGHGNSAVGCGLGPTTQCVSVCANQVLC